MKFNVLHVPKILLYEPFQLWSGEECKDLISRAKDGMNRGKVYHAHNYDNVRTNDVSWIDLTEDERNYCWEIVKPFWDVITWFEHPVQVSRYQPGQFYDWHIDEKPGNKRSSTRYLTLTCTLQTAPDAKFELKNRTYNLETGQAVIFPSKLDHRATAPSEAERWAFTIWYMKSNNK
jgi:hypothetical protein